MMRDIVVYLLTRNDNLSYIGITVDFNKRLMEHKRSSRFKELGIKEYKILYHAFDYQEARRVERILIKEFDTYHNGLNETETGNGNGIITEGFTTLGYKFSEESKKLMSDNNWSKRGFDNPMKGKKHSKETKENWSKLRKGKAWSKKADEKMIREILLLYKNKSLVFEGVGERQKGCQHILTYKNAFCKFISKKYNFSGKWVYNLLNGKYLTWNPLLNEIMNTKY